MVVLFAGALGDFVLALPALRLVRASRSPGPVVLGVRTPLVGLARAAVVAERVVSLDDAAMARFLGGGPPPPWWPRHPRLVSWFGAGDGTIRTRLRACSADALFLGVERGPGPTHAAACYATAVGQPAAWDELVRLAAVPAPARVVDRPPTLVVHRGAGGPGKRWDPRGFAVVAGWWKDRGGRVVDLLGPAEDGWAPLAGADVVCAPPLERLVTIVGQAAAFVGNDSGPSHLAGALGVRGVVLFGPTDPARWRPLSHRLAVVRAPAEACSPQGFTEPTAAVVIKELDARSLP